MTGTTSSRRIAILGLMLESNRFAPVTTKEDYLNRVYLAGNEILEDLNNSDPKLPAEIRGFFDAINAHCDWTPVPILVGLVEAGGPMDHAFYQETFENMKERLQAEMPLDAVYISNHGAMITTENLDPDGDIFAMVRSIVGPDVPVVATLDLHGNVSERMVETADAIVSYRTNPHVDMRERGIEVGNILLEMFSGMRPKSAFVRLPLTPPTVTLLTEHGPYADIINYGQSQITPDIANVSILGGFAYSDTPKNGLAIIVTARGDGGIAKKLARNIAVKAWDDFERYVPRLTPLKDAVKLVVAAGKDANLPAPILADVADNPGGGGNGNTMWILEALYKAKAVGVIVGIIYDPKLPESQQGRVETKLVSNIDIAPTFVDMAGVAVPSVHQGHSLVPLVEGKATTWREDFLCEHLFNRYNNWHGVRSCNYKYAVYYDDGYECLYDLEKDPAELNNLAVNPEYASVLSKMKERMNSYLTAYPKTEGAPPKAKAFKGARADAAKRRAARRKRAAEKVTCASNE